MHILSHCAIFWIIVTHAVGDSTKNGNEDAIQVKVSRVSLPTIGGDEKRLRQRRDNVTEAASRRSTIANESSSVNVIEDETRQSQHPVKKQFKFKRLRYLSVDQNGTKLVAEKLRSSDDTKDSSKRKSVADSPAATVVSTPQISDTKNNNDTVEGGSTTDGESVLSRSENTRAPSHRKKRRRIATSITALNTPPRLEANSSRNNLSQYLDFGRKISATAASPRRNVVVVASVTDSTDDSAPPVYVANAVNTSANQNKLTSADPICMTSYRPIRTAGIKDSKRELIQNNTLLCRWNVSEGMAERTSNRQPNKVETKNNDIDKVDDETSVRVPGTMKSGKNVAEGGAEVVPGLVDQSTTKIWSPMSVSVKHADERKLKISSSTTIPESTVRLPRKPDKDVRQDSREASLTPRPSLQPYSRYNTARNNSNRNLEISRSHQNAPAGKIFYDVKLATTESVRTSSANASESGIEYLTMNTTSPVGGKQDPDTLVLDLTTWKSTTTTTKNDFERKNASSTQPVVVTYDIVEKKTENWRYRVRNDSESRSSSSSSSSAGANPSLLTLFSRPIQQNYSTFGEQGFQPANGFHEAEGFEKAGTSDRNSSFHIVTYFLAGLGVIPLVIGIAIAIKMIAYPEKKKQIFEGSEYSSEYNRNPLEFSAGVTSSPVATKLPRVQQTHWEIERKPAPSVNAPINSQWEFPRNKLRLQTILGQGNFGQVWKAEADDISGHEGLTRLVAVKMVKEISSTREKEDLIKELMIMQHLGSHPNVVTLLGCCTEKEPYMLIMEYVMYGKLLSFLRDHRTRTHYFNFSDNGDTLTSRDLTVFAYYVARGMEYLQNKQVIHRDLAARNVLIDHNKLCKIADFGMSKYVDESGQVYEHRQSKGALPIRWMAPESLHYSCYTYKTDVWSFGILMWEIVTLGSMPYASMGARVVMRKVIEGYRLERPKHCKTPLFNVINKCWNSDPKKRPSFAELKQDLLNLLEDSESQGCYVDLDSLVDEMNQSVHGSHSEKNII